jgi:uncharacterized protein (TIGR03067 family)
MKRLFVIVVAFVFCLHIGVVAAEKKANGKVTAVDASGNSLTVEKLKLDVTRKTKITVNGKKATLADIQPGQNASVVYDENLEVAASISVGEGGDSGEATAKALKSLQGDWVCIAAEEVGKPLDKKVVREQDRRLNIKGNTMTMRRTVMGKRATYTGKFEIDADSGSFDFIGKGPDGMLVEWIGIYETEGDNLKLCYRYKRNDDAARPTSMKTDTTRPNICVFYTYKRDKE